MKNNYRQKALANAFKEDIDLTDAAIRKELQDLKRFGGRVLIGKKILKHVSRKKD